MSQVATFYGCQIDLTLGTLSSRTQHKKGKQVCKLKYSLTLTSRNKDFFRQDKKKILVEIHSTIKKKTDAYY